MADTTSPNASPAAIAADVPEAADAVSVAPNWKLVWWRFKKHRLAPIAGAIVIFIAIVALLPGFFSTQPPQQSETKGSFIPPQGLHFWDGGPALFAKAVTGARNPRSLRMEWTIDEDRKIPLRLFGTGYEYKALWLIRTNIHLIVPANPEDPAVHVLGTDRLGRDQWSRLMHGTQVSLSIGLVAVALSTILGITLGGISGYFGGLADMVIQRFVELLQSIPPIPIWLALTAAMPRTWSVQQTYLAITAILALIGWTTLLQEAQNLQSIALAPWLLLPGLAVIITVLALNILGDGLRDAADPYH